MLYIKEKKYFQLSITIKKNIQNCLTLFERLLIILNFLKNN